MTILLHELRLRRTGLLVWSLAVSALVAACVLIYPEMADQMDAVSQTFAQMGGFSAAFGMDQVDFGQFMGFFAVECGTCLGLGGGLFAALTGISALAGEEASHTASFLLTHPVSRPRVVGEKLLAAFHLTVSAVSLLAMAAIGERPDGKRLALLLLAGLLLELEVMALCFGISAFLRRGGGGIAMGLALGLYFLNLLANLTEGAAFLKYLTPFAYADGADIVSAGALESGPLAVGAVLSAAGILAAFWFYCRKDIAD